MNSSIKPIANTSTNFEKPRHRLEERSAEFGTKDSYALEQREHQRRKIISQCRAGNGTWIHKNPHGPQVILLSEIVVKFGLGVTKQEAETQAYYHRSAYRSCLIIPEVLDFFTDLTDTSTEHGFLVMEYIHGTTVADLQPHDKLKVATQISNAMKHLETVKPPCPSRPGPIIEGGIPCGYLWSYSGPYRTFETIDDLNTWLNRELSLSQPGMFINFDLHEFVSRHMDINTHKSYRP